MMLIFYWQKNRGETMNKIIIKLLITLVSTNMVVYGMERTSMFMVVYDIEETPMFKFHISWEDYENLKKEERGIEKHILKTYSVDVGRQPYSIFILSPAHAEKPKRDEIAISNYLEQLKVKYTVWKNAQTPKDSAVYCANFIQQCDKSPENLLHKDLPDVITLSELGKLPNYYRAEKNKEQKYYWKLAGVGLLTTLASATVAQNFIATLLAGANTLFLARRGYLPDQLLTQKETEADKIFMAGARLSHKTYENQEKIGDGTCMVIAPTYDVDLLPEKIIHC